MITSTTSQYPLALKHANYAREKGKTVVMGGPHPSFMYEDILRTGQVDYVVVSEGELTSCELAEALAGGRVVPEGIKGLAWLEDGQVRTSQSRPFIEDIDTIPIPDRTFLNIDAYRRTKLEKVYPATTMITSRGCPFDCSFCVSTQLTGSRWRKHSVDHVIEELRELVEVYGFEGVFFSDDNFSVDMKRIRELCGRIIEEKIKVRWWAMSRADTIVRNEQDIPLMRESGCGTVFLGVESPDERTLEAYNKKSTADTSREAVEILHRNGIRVQGSYILGGPGETVADIRRAVKYACQLNAKITQFTLLTPYPGSRLYYDVKDRICTDDWSLFDGMHAVFDSEGASVEQREREHRRAYRKFYTRPSYLLKHWRTINYKKTFSLIKSLKPGGDRNDG
jgi:anaerobic magnesium-protoporphyrin IX monomethyl ester cyclase